MGGAPSFFIPGQFGGGADPLTRTLVGKPKEPEKPKPPPKRTDKEIEAARRAALKSEAARGGRQSTVLTGSARGVVTPPQGQQAQLLGAG